MKDNLPLKEIVEERLKLQSTQRYLAANRVPGTIKFLASANFREIYDGWSKFKQRYFLEKIAGIKAKELRMWIEQKRNK